MAQTVAIMQPYVFPYLGYGCLVDACDTFVFYDDVAFIQKGWIHRNRIALQGQPHTFTVPLMHASQNVPICETRLHDIDTFAAKFLRQLEQGYRKAPHQEAGLHYVRTVLAEPGTTIADLAIRSVTVLWHMLGLEKTFLRSSGAFAHTRKLGRAERLIAITRALGADQYVNAPGGRELYQAETFAAQGVNLSFVAPELAPYPQAGTAEFLPNLSVIDALMQQDFASVRRLMQHHVLA